MALKGGESSAAILDVANRIRLERYADADVVFAAGSLVRGTGTPHSDIDLVVLCPRLAWAYRESFTFEGYPVEAFVHDPQTLEYFFVAIDRAAGIPILPEMVMQGVEMPGATDLSRAAKARAAEIVASGPAPLDERAAERTRYLLTGLVDDLRSPRSPNEIVGAGARLYELLADYWLRSRGRWSGRGKMIPRALSDVDPDVSARYCRSFERLFQTGDAREVIELAETLLAETGGMLFDGCRADAPPAWRA